MWTTSSSCNMRKEGSDQINTEQGSGLPRRPFMLFLYNFSLSLYRLAISIYSLFNAKAKKWIDGRRNWEQNLKTALKPNDKRIWIHCSSVGEFEQAKPVIEALKKSYPGHKMLVTFFSPSGFEACSTNKLIDHAFYLPQDSRSNAARFVESAEPQLVIFVKYEFWYHYLAELKKQKITTLLVSGAFRAEQPFFKPYGGLFRDMLTCFTYFFVQDKGSASILKTIGIENNVVVAGDTRYDRVSAIADNVRPISEIEKFKEGKKILIAGSTWPGDEEVLKECLPILPANWKLILVPHEIDEAHIKKVQELFGNDAVLFSSLSPENTGSDKKVLIVNTMGMLSRLYSCGDIAYIGGGFQKGGIHNILEPAVFGLPVLFGPVYQKFVEAKTLAELHYVFPINNAVEAKEKLNELIQKESYRSELNASLKKFMSEHIGASRVIADTIKREKWLD